MFSSGWAVVVQAICVSRHLWRRAILDLRFGRALELCVNHATPTVRDIAFAYPRHAQRESCETRIVYVSTLYNPFSVALRLQTSRHLESAVPSTFAQSLEPKQDLDGPSARVHAPFDDPQTAEHTGSVCDRFGVGETYV